MPPPRDPKTIFLEALDLGARERAQFLASACAGDERLRARVEALLAAEAGAGTFLSSPTVEGGAGETPERVGSRIGNYKLQQQIGEGGFGVVWMAEQTQPLRRQVALKVLKRGMDSGAVIARFEQERQALALMDHPNIAKVFDGGETGTGRPYFVMELVRGLPITQFCDQEHLDTVERLRLFVSVCHAVQHAHQKGVIHRDLKPSNVLVTLHDGVPVPKVIDFGIAKALHRPLTERTLFTEFRQMVGTPEYMSPEQAELSGLDIDTRADIYGLGVVLYELLTGTLPFDVGSKAKDGLFEILRVVREDEPQEPSTRVSTQGDGSTESARRRRTDPSRLARLLRGDLDWIVLKALEKDRSRRYVSADAFAADVQRHLRDEPVEAGPPGNLYRLIKFLRRHRLGVMAGTAVTASLLIGLSVAVWGLVAARVEAEKTSMALARAEDGESAAKKAAIRAGTVLEFVDEVLSSADPDGARGPSYRVGDLFEDFERRLGQQLEAEPEVAASVHQLLGRGLMSMGSYDRAETHLTRAATILETRNEDRLAIASVLRDRASLLVKRGKFADSLRLLDRAIALSQEWPGSADEILLHCTMERARVQLELGRFEAAEQDARGSLEIAARRTGTQAVQESAVASTVLAGIVLTRGRLDEARALMESALERLRAAPRPNVWAIVLAKQTFGRALQTHGQLEAAEHQFREALQGASEWFGEDHLRVASVRLDLAFVLRLRAKLPEAEEEARKGLSTLERLFANDEEKPWVVGAKSNLACILLDSGQLEEAEELMSEVLRSQGGRSARGSRGLGDDLNSMALMLLARHKLALAEESARAAIRVQREWYGESNAYVARATNTLGLVLLAERRLQEAEQVARESLDMKRRTYGDIDHPEIANGLNNLGNVLDKLGRHEEAELCARRALDMQQKLLGATHPNVAKAWNNLAAALGHQGRLVEAEESYRRALALVTERFGVYHPLVSDDLHNLGMLLEDQQKWVDAEQVYRQALDVTKQVYGTQHPYFAESLEDLSRVLSAQDRFEEAEPLARQALQSLLGLAERSTPRIVHSHQGLALILRRAGKLTEATGVLRDLVEFLRSTSPGGSMDLAISLRDLASYRLAAGDPAGALPSLDECEAMAAVLAPGSLFQCAVTSLRGHAVSRLGRHEEADTLLRECRKKLAALEGAAAEQRQTLLRLIENCEAWAQVDQAAAWRELLEREFPGGSK